MKTIRRTILAAGLVLAALLARAQSDTVVGLTAQNQNLTEVTEDQLPPMGATYWEIFPGSKSAVPLPCFFDDGTVQGIYVLSDTAGIYFVDDSATTNAVADAVLEAQAAAVTNLVADYQTFQAETRIGEPGAPRPMDSPPSPDGGSGGGEFTFTNSYFFTPDTNAVWLTITNVSLTNRLAWLNLHVPTNVISSGTNVYAIFTTTNVLTNWQVVALVFLPCPAPATNPVVVPFTLPTDGQPTLFAKAEDWTGVTTNGNVTPEWWFWYFFQTTDFADTNLDCLGNTFEYDYSNHFVPELCPASPTMVVAWGDDSDGQCEVPEGLTNAIAVSGGFNFSVALKANGTVVVWGDNTYGECEVPIGLTNVTAIAAGGAHVLALRQNGTVVAWGDGSSGQTNVPAGLTNVMAIAAGQACSFALQNDGTIVAWGYDYYGQTNIPACGPATQVAAGFVQGAALLNNHTVAMWAAYDFDGYPYYWGLTNEPSGLSNVVSIAAGGYHTLALQSNGAVQAWGAGAGAGTTAFDDFGQSVVPSGLSNVVTVAGGNVYSMALQTDGTVVEWGDDTYGELDQPDRLTGVQMVSAGGYHGLALRYGPLGPVIYEEPTNRTVSPGTNISFFVDAVGVAGVSYQWQLNGVNVPGATNATLTLSNVQSEVAGDYQAVLSSSYGTSTSDVVILTVLRPPGPGLISGWGSNTNGELSWQTDTTNVLSLAAGKAHGIVATDSGQVVSWGSYWTGYMYVPAAAPPVITNAIAVAAGSRHDLVLKADGTLTAWGYNDAGQTNIPAMAATNVIAIAAGGLQSLALLQNGTVVQWGQTNGPIPTGLANVTAIAAGTNFSLALLQNSTVVAWGANDYGQTNIPAGLSNVVAIAAGGSHALALKQDGTVTAWGSWTNVPANLTNVLNVAAGENHSIALKSDGTALCWGDNAYGETNVVSGLAKVKLIAGGGDFTLASEFAMWVSYPQDVSTNDLLLIYNTNSPNSLFVLNYYLANRPMVSGAHVLGVGWPGIFITNVASTGNYAGMTNTPDYESICPADCTNYVLNPVANWLAANPTLRPQYVVMMLDMPSRIWAGATNAAGYPFYANANANCSVSYQLSTSFTGWQPFINHINMYTTNDCVAYINKLQYFGTNYSPGRLILSASAQSYGNTNWYFDDTVLPPYQGNFTLGLITSSGVIQSGASPASVNYTNVIPDNGLSNHITSGFNVAGYTCWGTHSTLGNYYAGRVSWTGNSAWYLIETFESFNGQRYEYGQGNFCDWFYNGAFGAGNYSNTPVAAVSTEDEPGIGAVNDQSALFGFWASGKNFGICVWASNPKPQIQAVGDPFITK